MPWPEAAAGPAGADAQPAMRILQQWILSTPTFVVFLREVYMAPLLLHPLWSLLQPCTRAQGDTAL